MDAVAQKEGFSLSVGPLDPRRGRLAAEICRRTNNVNASIRLGDAAAAGEELERATGWRYAGLDSSPAPEG